MNATLLLRTALAGLLGGLFSTSLPAADRVKANNADALNLPTSWTGPVPTSADVAVWDHTITANRSTVLGADLSFGGIRIANPGGTATLMTISSSTGTTHTLTLGSSGIDMSEATVDLTITSNIVLGASQTWEVAAGRTLSSSGTLSGSGILTLAGPGRVFLTGNTSLHSGGTRLDDGVEVLINSGSTGTPFGLGTLTVGQNVRIAGTATGARFINNAVVLNGDLTVGRSDLAAGNTFNFTGGIEVGNATRTLNFVNTDANLYGNGKSITGTGNGRLILANGNAGASPVVLVRLGEVGQTFSVTSDLTVGTNVLLYFNASNTLGSNAGLTIQSGGTLDLSNRGGAAFTQTIQSLEGAGTVTSNRTSAAISTLIIDGGTGTGSTTFSGNIVTGPSGASVAVTKQGQTTQIFSGSNNYTGQTIVTAGTLLINGTHTDSGAGTGNGYGHISIGHFQVADGATFGGSGRIAGNNAQNNSNLVLVQSGGTLAPGAGIGTLTLNGANLTGTNRRILNMATGAKFAFQLAGNGSAADQIALWNYASGDLLLNSNQINLTLSGPVVAGTYTVTLFSFYSDGGLTLTGSGITGGLVIGSLDPRIIDTPTLAYNAGGNRIQLTYTVIPEPSTAALAGAGLALGFWSAARRRGKQVPSSMNV